MSDERTGAEIFVRGRVQGVGFRMFCVRAAERLGVVGYAMNLADGGVRVVAEGNREAIEAFVRVLETGPRLARVEQATVTWHSPSERFSGFGIRDAGDDA